MTYNLFSLAEALGLDRAAMQSFLDFYNNDFSAYGNEVYTDVRSRIAHWVNFSAGGWFAERLNIFLNRVDEFSNEPLVVVDLGFSVPYAYARPSLLEAKDTRFLFVDKEVSTLQFYSCFVARNNLRARSSLDWPILADIESEQGNKRIVGAARALLTENRPRKLLIFSSETIEHLAAPAQAWKLMKDLTHAYDGIDHEIHITLPIGRIIPSHTISFETVESARDYVERHMTVTDWTILQPGPDQSPSVFLTHCVYARGQFPR
jgi:hypothetical protein